ncbi:MAG TPA: exo 1,3/1,4-beta-D-glucan glucohydrolase [Thermoanaerobaculia bacterium]|nr:exo 1,3/1,4-beta-D-glucan glucohydrolase [Thermoanaerobaculia bacterium]
MRALTTPGLAVAIAGLLVAAPSPAGAQPGGGPAHVDPAAWPAVASPVTTGPDEARFVEELLARMTLEEKVGQVIQAEIRYVTPDDVRRYHLGSVLNGGGSHPGNDKRARVEDWLALADAFYEASTDTSDGGQAIPVLWGVDAVHGHNNVIGATLFPHNIGLGAARDPLLVRRIAEITALEVAVTGLDWTFGPTVAVARDDRWGRTYESYSEDPALVRRYAREVVAGLQGRPGTDGWLDSDHVVATAKHFLGDGGTVDGRDQGDAVATEAELRDVHGAGYVSALEAGVQTVMASFSSWHGQKMHGNRALLTDVLKERMGFDGLVVGDWNGHGQLAGCANDSCAAAFNAGIDMFMVPEDWRALHQNTLQQVERGEIAASRLDDAVRRILRVKARAGLFTRGRPSSRPVAGNTELLGAPEHREIARRAVRESLVLLKNRSRLLPLDPRGRYLVVGDGADDVAKQAGGWTLTWQGTDNVADDFPGATSIWGGIEAAVAGAGGSVELAAGGGYQGSIPPGPYDAVIAVYGEDPYAEFQGDRESLDYRSAGDRDLVLLEKARAAGHRVVSVFLSGRPLWVNPELNASDAFVAAWLPGSEGAGVADLLFAEPDGDGARDFRGRLSFSWPRAPLQTPLNVGDPDDHPLFPYGFGLGYADDGDLPELPVDLPGAAPEPGATVYFDDGPVPPWRLDSAGVELRAVARRLQEDAREVRWSGADGAFVALRGEEPIDLRREANGEMELAIDLLVVRPPAGSVRLGVGCGEGCAGDLEVGARLRDLEPERWHTLAIRLRCFAEAGADLGRIDTPMRLAAEGALVLRFSEIRLAPAGPDPSCP